MRFPPFGLLLWRQNDNKAKQRALREQDDGKLEHCSSKSQQQSNLTLWPFFFGQNSLAFRKE